MSIIVKSRNDEKTFSSKALINVGTNPKCDVFLELDYDILLTVQYNPETSTCNVINNFKSPNILYKGEILTKISVENACKITFRDSEEYLEVLLSQNNSGRDGLSSLDSVVLSDDKLKELYGDDEFSEIKIKLEQAREPIEKARIAIIKQVAHPIQELKSKIKANMRTSIIMHIALYFAALLSAFAVANYLMGLSVQEAVKHVYLATNIQAWVVYSFVILAVCLMLKQGVFLFLNEKTLKNATSSAKIAKNFMLGISALFIVGIYAVNLTYYGAISDFAGFALFITLFMVGAMTALAVACGYFKANSDTYNSMLYKFEFREDFESIIKAYRIWIERYANSLSKNKLDKIKDRMFLLQIEGVVETVIGILTAPFLAYGVSNTLAMCFPEAAGWTRISGFRFSPVFLVLATFLIIFAFFSFVNAFVAGKKVKASEVIKQDGFSDFKQHGVNILGLEGARKFESDKKLFLAIACSIVFIEFMMNISYFMTEMGEETKGVFLSLVAALVPTALLIAETLMLAESRFKIEAHDELLSKLDKE